jgi:hypothetical protein
MRVSSFTTPQTSYQYEAEVSNQLLQNMRDLAHCHRAAVGTLVEANLASEDGVLLACEIFVGGKELLR